MTIQAFAKLCGCNPQTLRYYDKVGLLRPSRVDKFSGYRHYEEEQALTFVKIKNLQQAGFSIEEIRPLLRADDDTVYRAFEEKIGEQQAKLENMRKIQRSYRSEMNVMQENIERIRQEMAAFDPKTEFGISRERYETIVQRVEQLFSCAPTQAEDPDITVETDEAVLDPLPALLKNPGYETVYEKHGWAYVKDFLPEIATLDDGAEHQLLFLLREDKANLTAFSTTILNLLLDAKEGKRRQLGCCTHETQDGQNHFWLLKRK